MIHDEYAGRTDLTPYQKRFLRNPEKVRGYGRKWRANNIEKARRSTRLTMQRKRDEDAGYSMKRKILSRVHRAQKNTESMVENGRILKCRQAKEILHFHERGRDASTIAIMLRCQMSRVLAVISAWAAVDSTKLKGEK
jgi:hypothetical protein